MAVFLSGDKFPFPDIAHRFRFDGTDLSRGVNHQVEKHMTRERRLERGAEHVDWLGRANSRFFKDGRVFLPTRRIRAPVNLTENSVSSATGYCQVDSVKICCRPHFAQ